MAAEIDASALYQKHCSVCHGETGDGQSRAYSNLTPPPRDFTSPEAAALLGRDRMIQSVAEGRPGTVMAGWKERLSAAEIEAVVDYIRKDFMLAADAAASAEMKEHLVQGERLYMENCSVCHGDYGSTGYWIRNSMDTSPRNFTSDFSKNVLTRMRMIESVTRGRPGTAMMPYESRLSPDQIASVVDYVRILLMGIPLEQVESEAKADLALRAAVAQGEVVPQEGAPAVSSDFMSRAFPDQLTGDVDRGRALFARNCVACHGRNGDGKGPRAYFIKPKPRNFIADDSRRALNRPKIYTAVFNGLKGSVMPAWGKVLSAQQVADVGEFVFQAFILGEARGISDADLAAAEARGEQKKN